MRTNRTAPDRFWQLLTLRDMAEKSTAGRTAIIQYSYEGTPISFSNADGVMVNATQMAKPFGKKAVDFLKIQQTKDFLQELSEVKKITSTELVQVTYGNNGGTWMHEDVAMEFARWLSPKFAIWCNDRIKELLTQGVTTVSDDDDVISNAMAILQRRLQEKERRLQEKEQRLQLASTTIEQQGQRIVEQRNEIATLTPMADYTREVLQSTSTFTLTQVAKDLGLRSVMVLTEFCREARILYRQSGQWLPTAKYSGKGFFETRTAKYVKSDNTIGTSLSTVVTEKGRVMLRKMMEQKGGVA